MSPHHAFSTASSCLDFDTALEPMRRMLIGYTANDFGLDLAEDFAQETLIRAYQQLPAYRSTWSDPRTPDGKPNPQDWNQRALKSWLVRVLQSVVSDHLSKPSTREVSLSASDLEHDPSPAQRSIYWDCLRGDVRRLLSFTPLTTAQRAVILARLEGYTLAEIARRLDVSVQCVSEHGRRAMRRLTAAAAMLHGVDSAEFRRMSRQTSYHRPKRRGAEVAERRIRSIDRWNAMARGGALDASRRTELSPEASEVQ